MTDKTDMTDVDVACSRPVALQRLLLRVCAAAILVCMSLLAPVAYAQSHEPDLSLMPQPAHVATQPVEALRKPLRLDAGFRFLAEGVSEPRLERARLRFLEQLSRRTGILRWPTDTASQPRFVVRVARVGAPVQQLGEDESYHLQVLSDGVTLSAPTPLGILHGYQTLLQLVRITSTGWTMPAVTIDDAPRFPWRGLMIDCGRHFMPLDVLRQNLDLMEAAKLNVFHWHLSEDQGFRIESRLYPKLQGEGSDGLFYTQNEVRALIEYARDRGIRVVPEFDMPGHAGSWFVGYPELASGPSPYRIERKWGIFDPAMDPTRESTYSFLDRFLGEMTALFADSYFHIGGDECNGKEWDRNPRIHAFMQEHRLKDNAALQAYFTARVQKLVTAHGKITTGWDEVLQPDTPHDVVIQSWRGQDSLAVAARQGNRALLSWGYYLDLNEPASQHYGVDPLGGDAGTLTPAQRQLVLGGEAAMWSEYIAPEILGRRVWPRAAAVAERLWSPQSVTDTVSMYQRLGVFSANLVWYGLGTEPIDRGRFGRLLGPEVDPSSLMVLASVVEPTKEYAREELGDYTSNTPLNRLVDIVPAESEQARTFNELAKSIVSMHSAGSGGDTGNTAEARRRLTTWRDNDAELQKLLPSSALTAELAPVSRNLAQAATIGLAALDAIEENKPAPASLQAHQLAALKKLAAPQAVLLNAMLPGVETLVKGSTR